MPKQLFSLVIILANILLTYLVISDPLRTVNADGVLYLEAAKAYLQGGWHAAMQNYPWPFYSVLIAWVSQIFHCSLQFAAYFLNVIFQILICLGFFNLACKVQGISKYRPFLQRGPLEQSSSGGFKDQKISSRYVQPTFLKRMYLRFFNDVSSSTLPIKDPSLFMTLTVLVILFYPTFNHHRDLIIRDFGYWAFSLWGWFYLICLNEKQSFFAGIKFNISMLLSSLFRLEGIVLLLFSPLALFFTRENTTQEKIENFLKAYLVTVIILISGLIYCWMHAYTLNSFGRLIELKSQVQFGIQAIIDGLSRAKNNILHNVLTPASAGSVFPLLFGGLISVYVKNLIMTLTPFYSILFAVFLWKKSFSPTVKTKPILYIAILINIFITVVFLMQSLFLNERYLFGLAFLLLLWIPPGLLWIREKTQGPVVIPTQGVTAVMPAKAGLQEGDSSSRSRQPRDQVARAGSLLGMTARQKAFLETAVGRKWLFPSILVFLIGIGVISLHHFGRSKIYIKDAGSWVHKNLPERASIYTNNLQLKFYINRPFTVWQNGISDKNVSNIIQNAKLQNYSYLVFQVSANNLELKNQLNQLLPKPIKVFKNKKGDAVLVFYLNKNV